MTSRKMHAGEVDVDPRLVRRLLAARFPEWAEQPLRRVPSDGTVNALYRIGDDLVVRLPRIEAWVEDVDEQHELLTRLAPQLPVAIPVPVAKGEPAEGYPWRWSVYRWLEGEALTADNVTDGDLLAKDLARFVAALRRVEPADGPPSFRGRALLRGDAKLRAAIDAVRGMVDAGAVTEVWEESLRAPAWEGPPVWVHGDLLPSNLLVDGGRLSAVIDFGGIGVGDPAIDLIPAWSVLNAGTREVFRDGLAADDAAWARGRGWALWVAAMALPYYLHTNPAFTELARRMIAEILADRRRRR